MLKDGVRCLEMEHNGRISARRLVSAGWLAGTQRVGGGVKLSRSHASYWVSPNRFSPLSGQVRPRAQLHLTPLAPFAAAAEGIGNSLVTRWLANGTGS